jgi:UDP-MurNAc hydroxylase
VELTALGQAGWRISGTHTAGLLNPWFGASGAFLGSWFPLPDNQHLATDEFLAADWVAVASARDDHLDVATLTRVAAGTPVFVPAASHGHLVAAMESTSAVEVVEVQPWERVALGGDDWLTFLPPARSVPPISPVLVHVDGTSLLAAAPGAPNPTQVQRAQDVLGGRLEVLAVHTAIVAPDVMCDVTHPLTSPRRALERRLASLQIAAALARVTRPELVVPHGGPPCFVDPDVAHHNRWLAPGSLLPDVRQAADWLRAAIPHPRVVPLLPGDRCHPSEQLVFDDARWTSFSFADLDRYLARYRYARALELSRLHARFPPPGRDLGRRLATNVARIVGRVPGASRGVHDSVRFEVTGAHGGSWDVRVDGTATAVEPSVSKRSTPCRFRVPSHWLGAVVEGRASWNQLLLSLRYEIVHDPPRAHDPLLDLLARADAGGARSASTAVDPAR